MCGIVGYIGHKEAAPLLVEGLQRLEYRGYDSAGIAVFGACGVQVRRANGKLKNLRGLLAQLPAYGHVGIGHTRWATHGAPETRNAHPHTSGAEGGRVSVVHNGIVENHAVLRAGLQAQGLVFLSDTDTEVIAHLATSFVQAGLSPRDAARAAFARLEGSFAAALLFEADPDRIYVARRGSPLALGRGAGECFIGSDALALAPLTRQITYLEEGDFAAVGRDGFVVEDALGHVVDRTEVWSDVAADATDLGGYAHYMRKEIDEQPAALRRTLDHYLPSGSAATPAQMGLDFSHYDRVLLVACGTAFYACLTARYWFEQHARLPVDLDVASEFRYRMPPVPARTLAVFVSQSGETADTLAALRYAKEQGAATVALVNTLGSSIARESGLAFPLLAGPEIGVASTKAFTCQLAALAALAIKAARDRAALPDGAIKDLEQALQALPELVEDAIACESQVAQVAAGLAQARDMIFLGRHAMHAIALEGALKIKEISYIHAEGYAAGELKHGPIALIDPDMPVVALVPGGALAEKSQSNVQEVLARGGRVVLVGPADTPLDAHVRVPMAQIPELVAPIVYAVPMQLLAYHAALVRGADVDQPRNLAKAVTVE